MAKPWLNYHHLLYFKTIANEGGVAKAAKKLRLGQPTLSTQLKQFEHVLGHTLFDRTKRHLTLSEAGKTVLGYAEEIFKLGDELLDALNDSHTSPKIQLQLGLTESVPRSVATQSFQLCIKHFNCNVTMSNSSLTELFRELRAHHLDLVMSTVVPPPSETSGFYSKLIARFPIVVCGSPTFLKLQNQFPKSLQGAPFITPHSSSKLYQHMNHFFKTHEIFVDKIAEIQDIAIQKKLALEGAGLIALPAPAAEEYIQSKDLIAIGTLADVYEELWFTTAQRRVLNPVAALLMREFAPT
jgi:LysR family transcriptional activator of nhaA